MLLSSEGLVEREKRRDAVGELLLLLVEGGEALILGLGLGFREAVDVARGEVAAVVVLGGGGGGDVVVVGGGSEAGCVVICPCAADTDVDVVTSAGEDCASFPFPLPPDPAPPAPAPESPILVAKPCLSLHNTAPIFTGSVENSTPGNTLSKVAPRGCVPAVSLKHWHRMFESGIGTLEPALTCMDTPFWVMEEKSLLKGTLRVVDVSSAVVARLRVTVPWDRTNAGRKGRRMRRRWWGVWGRRMVGKREDWWEI